MGHKVNPNIFRIGVNKTWDSKWFSRKNYIVLLMQDIRIRKFLSKKLRGCGLDKVEIERSQDTMEIKLHTAKPGVIIGRGGSGVEDLKKEIENIIQNKKIKINLNIQEMRQSNLSAAIVAEGVAMDIEKRIPFRWAIKQAIERVRRAGALGVKVSIAGRLNGAEIARRETLASGSLPLHTLRADVDFAKVEAHTSSYGSIGVKVWVYKGQVFNK